MNLGMPEMIAIFFLALIVLGPRRLPEVARQVGKFMAEVKRASNQFQSQIEDEVRRLELDEKALTAKEQPQAVLSTPAAQASASEAAASLEAEPTILPPQGPPGNPMIVPPNGSTASSARMHPEPSDPPTSQEQQA